MPTILAIPVKNNDLNIFQNICDTDEAFMFDVLFLFCFQVEPFH